MHTLHKNDILVRTHTAPVNRVVRNTRAATSVVAAEHTLWLESFQNLLKTCFIQVWQMNAQVEGDMSHPSLSFADAAKGTTDLPDASPSSDAASAMDANTPSSDANDAAERTYDEDEHIVVNVDAGPEGDTQGHTTTSLQQSVRRRSPTPSWFVSGCTSISPPPVSAGSHLSSNPAAAISSTSTSHEDVCDVCDVCEFTASRRKEL